MGHMHIDLSLRARYRRYHLIGLSCTSMFLVKGIPESFIQITSFNRELCKEVGKKQKYLDFFHN